MLDGAADLFLTGLFILLIYLFIYFHQYVIVSIDHFAVIQQLARNYMRSDMWVPFLFFHYY
jgi:hypothetical protein